MAVPPAASADVVKPAAVYWPNSVMLADWPPPLRVSVPLEVLLL